MSDTTKIEWADRTFNPWEGCTKVSPGCKHCYAEARNHRFGMDNWGKGKPRRRTSAANWRKPISWNRDCYHVGHGIVRERIFPSLCDWLDEEVPIEWLADFLKLIHDTPHLDWLLLTKRPENCNLQLARACEFMPSIEGSWKAIEWLQDWLRGNATPSNVWIGTSVENQEYADKRIPELLKMPAKVHFLSCEPLLGPIDLCLSNFSAVFARGSIGDAKCNWVIVGGESGPGARPCNIEWVRSIVAQCKAASVPCFVKQLGGNLSDTDLSECAKASGKSMHHPKGGDIEEWPTDLRVREFPV